ncbi:MAG: hypothetical protein NXI31_24375 [bacterium]|nr:hypothetical protein [bacterium]
MNSAIRSIDGVCRVELVRGAEAAADAAIDFLFEVPHGATRGEHFTRLHSQLVGDVPADLIEFFFVNTDVGAPELALAIARCVTVAEPQRTALVITSELPRTLVDCNRKLDPDSVPESSRAGQLTPGLPPWIREPADQRRLLELHAAYRTVVAAAFAEVCGRAPRADDNAGVGLMVHSYAPRSLDVAVDDAIVTHLRHAYERPEDWPLRAEFDLITHDPDGRGLAHAALAAQVGENLRAIGRQVESNGVYSLHPSTLAHEFAAAYPGRTLCFEARRDLLVAEFVPFVELEVAAAKVTPLADAFARALLER